MGRATKFGNAANGKLFLSNKKKYIFWKILEKKRGHENSYPSRVKTSWIFINRFSVRFPGILLPFRKFLLFSWQVFHLPASVPIPEALSVFDKLSVSVGWVFIRLFPHILPSLLFCVFFSQWAPEMTSTTICLKVNIYLRHLLHYFESANSFSPARYLSVVVSHRQKEKHRRIKSADWTFPTCDNGGYF